jgi:hypothetical protein
MAARRALYRASLRQPQFPVWAWLRLHPARRGARMETSPAGRATCLFNFTPRLMFH